MHGILAGVIPSCIDCPEGLANIPFSDDTINRGPFWETPKVTARGTRYAAPRELAALSLLVKHRPRPQARDPSRFHPGCTSGGSIDRLCHAGAHEGMHFSSIRCTEWKSIIVSNRTPRQPAAARRSGGCATSIALGREILALASSCSHEEGPEATRLSLRILRCNVHP